MFGKMTPQVHSKRRPLNEQTNKQDQMMSSADDEKTPESGMKRLRSDAGGKEGQLRTAERARGVPLEEPTQNEGEAADERLQLTPMMLSSKPAGEAGSSESNGGLAGTDRPKRKTRNMKNSRYDGADYLVDFSGSGQHNKYKLRKAAEAGEETLLSNCLALTMNAASTGEQTK